MISKLILAVIAASSLSAQAFAAPPPILGSNNAFTGANRFSGVVIAKNVNNILHVGAGTSWPGDIGQQINAAYVSLPANGGTIVVNPQSSGHCYLFSTPIVLTTAGKYVELRSDAPAGGAAVGTCLNYTPISATNALTLDYAVTGAPPPGQHGLRDIALINNGCTKTGGCGSVATGIRIGNSNAGAWDASFDNVSIYGFGIGYFNNSKLSVGTDWRNPTFVANTVCLEIGLATEKYESGTFAGNGKIFQAPTTASPELYFSGTNTYDNISSPIFDFAGTNNPAYLSFVNVHLENSPTTAAHYIGGNVNVFMAGGIVEDDNSTGTGDWMFSQTGYEFTMYGTRVLSPRPYTQIFLARSPTRAMLQPVNASPRFLTTWVGGTWASKATVLPTVALGSRPSEEWQFESKVKLTNGLAVSGGATTLLGALIPAQTTVSSLPSCNSGAKGELYVVTDANSPTYLGAISGGGNTVTTALCNGAYWVSN